MKITRLVVGPIETNCYLLEKENQVLVIDPGEESERIKKTIGDKKVIGVVITHYHFDHIGALKDLTSFYQVPVYDRTSLQEGMNQVGLFTFEMIPTPGHKEDLISIYFKEEKAMFVGDFIFQGSIGRMDLPGGNEVDMKHSLDKIKQYPKDITIYPGHGEKTSLQEEMLKNPYFFAFEQE